MENPAINILPPEPALAPDFLPVGSSPVLRRSARLTERYITEGQAARAVRFRDPQDDGADPSVHPSGSNSRCLLVMLLEKMAPTDIKKSIKN